MGIRFYCPNGHKLNVKTFLAGKRGICPRCGSKLEIPTESVRPPSARKKRGKAKSGQPIVGENEAAAIRREAAVLPELVGAAVQSDAVPASNPFADLMPVPAETQARSSAIESESAIGTNNKVGSTITKSAAAATPSTTIDPIAESPTAIWYVRPAAGGQFGPAAGDVMRQWLAQRRVGSDSMVWRETWADWRRADAVFPLLFAGAAASALPATSIALAAAADSPAKNFADDADWVGALVDPKVPLENLPAADQPMPSARHKRKSNNTIVIVSFFLILLCLLLVAVMITAYFHQKGESSDTSTSMLPTRSRVVADCSLELNAVPLVAPTAMA